MTHVNNNAALVVRDCLYVPLDRYHHASHSSSDCFWAPCVCRRNGQNALIVRVRHDGCNRQSCCARCWVGIGNGYGVEVIFLKKYMTHVDNLAALVLHSLCTCPRNSLWTWMRNVWIDTITLHTLIRRLVKNKARLVFNSFASFKKEWELLFWKGMKSNKRGEIKNDWKKGKQKFYTTRKRWELKIIGKNERLVLQ